jgi:uncharacterized membrane protein YhdT
MCKILKIEICDFASWIVFTFGMSSFGEKVGSPHVVALYSATTPLMYVGCHVGLRFIFSGVL